MLTSEVDRQNTVRIQEGGVARNSFTIELFYMFGALCLSVK